MIRKEVGYAAKSECMLLKHRAILTRRVRLWDGQGNEVQSPDGPFLVWDACLYNCENLTEIDGEPFGQEGFGALLIIASVYVGLTREQSCAYTNPQGLRYQVLDNTIWNPS